MITKMYVAFTLWEQKETMLSLMTMCTKILKGYEGIIREKRAKEIIERAEEEVNENIHEKILQLRQSPLIRESAEISKMRIIYDASAKLGKGSVSLNGFLETSNSLQNSH